LIDNPDRAVVAQRRASRLNNVSMGVSTADVLEYAAKTANHAYDVAR
jgi:hypothetical protein